MHHTAALSHDLPKTKKCAILITKRKKSQIITKTYDGNFFRRPGRSYREFHWSVRLFGGRFSSVLSRGLGVSPLSAIRRLAQDTGEMPRDDQTTPPPSSSGDSQPAAAPPATEQPPGEPRGDDPAPPVVREPGSPVGWNRQPATNRQSSSARSGETRRDSPEGQQPNGNPPVSSVPPRTSENDGTNRPEGRPSESGDEVRGGQSDDGQQVQDEARRKKDEERQKKEEERQKARDAKQLAQMKREMKRRTSELNRMEKTFK